MLRIAVGVLVLAGASLAEPSVTLELVPSHPGPYFTREVITVDVWAHSQRPVDTYIWFAQLDFTDTDGAFGLGSMFAFDLSSSSSPAQFKQDPGLPIPWVLNELEIACDPCRLQLPVGGSLHIGSIGVRTPAAAGTYRLDVANADDANAEHGVLLRNNGSLILRAFTGDIEGGFLDLHVSAAPIPTLSQWGLAIMATLLVAIGSSVLAQRSRGASMNSRFLGLMRRSGSSANRAAALAFAAVGAVAALGDNVSADPLSVPIEVTQTSFDSGIVTATGEGSDPVVVFSQLISQVTAKWVRLHFRHVLLSGSESSENESIIRVTSQGDGAV